MSIISTLRERRRKLTLARSKKQFLSFLDAMAEISQDKEVRESLIKMIEIGEAMAHKLENETAEETEEIMDLNNEIWRYEAGQAHEREIARNKTE